MVDDVLQASIDDGYRALMAAIVFQAIEDYNTSPKGAIGDMRRNRIEEFIRSPYFVDLSNLDQDWLIETLREENKHKIKEVA